MKLVSNLVPKAFEDCILNTSFSKFVTYYQIHFNLKFCICRSLIPGQNCADHFLPLRTLVSVHLVLIFISLQAKEVQKNLSYV